MQDDPYKAPESDLTLDQVALPKTLWWKIYFFLLLLLTLAVIAWAVLAEPSVFTLVEIIDLVLSFVGIVGLFGLAFNKAIGQQVFWKYFFYVNVVSSLIYMFVFPLAGIAFYGTVSEFNLEFAISVLLVVPLLWASYLYAYRRGMLWEMI